MSPIRLAACLSTMLLAACAGSDTRSSAPLAARLPETLLVFQRQDVSVLPTSPPSIVIRYRHEATSGTATVFLRPSEGSPVPDGVDSATVRDEVGSLTLALISHLDGVPLVRLPDHMLTRKGDGAPALRCGNVMVPAAPQVVRRDMLCVGGVAGHLLTVRVTGLHPVDKAQLAHVLFSAVAMRAWQSLQQGGEAPAGGLPAVEEPALADPGGEIYRL